MAEQCLTSVDRLREDLKDLGFPSVLVIFYVWGIEDKLGEVRELGSVLGREKLPRANSTGGKQVSED